jgi:hypothetical protein
VISYDVTFTIPSGEKHGEATFEALTGYMPPAFTNFFQYDRAAERLLPLTDGPGEIGSPIVFATADGSHAMGIYAPPQPAPGTRGPTYGRWRFVREHVVKWNCVFRLRNRNGIAPGNYAYRMFVIVGDRQTVVASMNALEDAFRATGPQRPSARPEGV